MKTPIFTDDASTGRTLRNVKKTLATSLENKYGLTDEEVLESILKEHGLSKDSLDIVSNVERTINSRLNDVSADANSNKNTKTVEGIYQEVFIPYKKLVGYDYLYRVMKSMYGRQEAKRLSGELYDMSLMISDSGHILKPYCWALNAQFINTDGRNWGILQSKPAKRLSSYISALCETVHEMSNALAGAIAISTFFMDIYHVLQLKENIGLVYIKNDEEVRKYVENEMQQFLHSVNHLSRNASESPFTNISVFDSVKLTHLVEEMRWYFGDYDVNYVVDYIMELQKIFINFFDKGDPMANGRPYRFPVVTVNFAKKKNGTEHVEDEAFLDYFVKKDFYRYNIFVSEGSKVASCCRLLSDTEMLDLAASVNSFGGSSISLGSHRVVTINFNRIALEAKGNKEKYFEILKSRIDDSIKVLAAHKSLLGILTDKDLEKFISLGIISMKRMFSTIGVLGLVEAQDTLRKDTLIAESLTFLNEYAINVGKEHGLIVNIEQIPAESMAVRAAETDNSIFGTGYTLYANQFVPLWEDASIWDRMETDGKYNKLITGGGIVHGTLLEKVTPTQAKQLINFAVDSGCEHFALNAVYSQCDNGHNHFGKMDKCPDCGSPITDYFTRVVGFMVPVSSWNKTRREWEFSRRINCAIKSI